MDSARSVFDLSPSEKLQLVDTRVKILVRVVACVLVLKADKHLFTVKFLFVVLKALIKKRFQLSILTNYLFLKMARR